MTTARTHQRNVGRGSHRAILPTTKTEVFTAVSADAFILSDDGLGVEPVDEGPIDIESFDYDPADHNVEEVKAHVTEHPDQAEAILELELNGKARSGLLSFLENFDTESEN